MIRKIEHSNEEVAKQIFNVFQTSYKAEAKLIGLEDFPPLSRSSKDIETSTSQYFGFTEDNCLAAVIEIVIENERLEICSLTVDPNYFRRGIADKLINHILDNSDCVEAVVETAIANTPAIKLYEKHGFIEYRRWKTSHGISKLAMLAKISL